MKRFNPLVLLIGILAILWAILVTRPVPLHRLEGVPALTYAWRYEPAPVVWTAIYRGERFPTCFTSRRPR